MVTPLTTPLTITQPWALNGNKNVIPTLPDTTPGHASYELGFPPLTMTPIEDGGVPPSGLDMNGALNAVTQHTVWVAAGGQYTFNASLATATGGYKLGCVLQSNDGLSSYVSLVNNNTVDFNSTPSSIGTQWAVYSGAAAGNSAATVVTTGGSTTLSAAQYNAGFVTVTGVLTSNATLVFPNYVRRWSIINNTTGAFSLTAKSAATPGVPIRQGSTDTVMFNGTAIGYDSASCVTRSPLDNSTAQASTAYVEAAVGTGLANAAPFYINANYTAGQSGDLWVDTRAGAITITLPDPGIGGNPINIRDAGGAMAVNYLTINPGTKTIENVAAPLICNIPGVVFGLFYDSANSNWRII